MKRFNTLLLAVLFIFSCNKKNLSGDIRPFDAPYVSINYPENVIIPAPKLISSEQHVFFAFSDKTKIFTDTKELKPLVQREFADKYGLKVKNNNSIEIPNSIFFSISNSIEQEEGYKIKISKKQVLISAKTQKGIFYAIQSLNFIFPKKLQQHPSSIPAVTIEDFPEFSYRGMHLDVARHFFPVSFIKKYIDYLARYKYNYFHWHLTEDQGWRIEIKKYPKLQEIAAYRDETLIGHYSNKPHQFDGKKYGGFYTQEEIKEIVAYAENKQITIIPEIEMPGHAQAALAAYPELGCGKDEYKVATKWGIFEDVYCPTETTFKFLEDVIDEVIELFPSKYIHIGGDECPKTAWKENTFCQDLIKKNNLKNEHGLQSYFIQRMEKYINSKGKQIIGWDEILEGGLAPNATVMSWRGMKGGIEAATQGHDVIMTPGSHCYFDHYQSDSPKEPLAIGGFTSLEKVYNFNPIPPSLSASEAQHILGAQGNVWTEYMKTPEKVAYMIFPRMLALSEVIWSGNQNKDYDLFVKRAEEHLYQLKKEGINVANHLSDIKAKIKSGEGNGVTLNCITESSSNTIHYTTDDFNLDNKSKLFPENLKITESQKIKVQAFSNGTKKGNGVTIDFNIHKAAGKKIALINAPSPKYNTGGKGALINGVLGNSKRYGDAEWLGFEGKDCIGIIDFDKKTTTNSIYIRFFNGKGQWIYPPKNIEVLGSNDGNSFKLITDYKLDSSNDKIVPVTLKYPASNYQFLKIWIHRHGIIAGGKQGGGHEAWLFVDEIVVE